MKRAASLLAAGLMVLAVTPPAQASTSLVSMTNSLTYDPTPVSVALGDTVQWNNDADFSHTATQNAGFFDTGTVTAGNSKSKLFKFGGTFPYHCQIHGPTMHGTVKVLDKWLNTGAQHPGDEQKIRIAAVKAPAPLAFDVQMRVTGDDTWTPFKQKIKNAIVKFTPSEADEYQFRSRLHRLSNNQVSGWSPTLFVEIDPA